MRKENKVELVKDLTQKFKENNSSKTINNFKNFKNEKVYILIFYVSRFSINFL